MGAGGWQGGYGGWQGASRTGVRTEEGQTGAGGAAKNQVAVKASSTLTRATTPIPLRTCDPQPSCKPAGLAPGEQVVQRDRGRQLAQQWVGGDAGRGREQQRAEGLDGAVRLPQLLQRVQLLPHCRLQLRQVLGNLRMRACEVWVRAGEVRRGRRTVKGSMRCRAPLACLAP